MKEAMARERGVFMEQWKLEMNNKNVRGRAPEDEDANPSPNKKHKPGGKVYNKSICNCFSDRLASLYLCDSLLLAAT